MTNDLFPKPPEDYIPRFDRTMFTLIFVAIGLYFIKAITDYFNL